MVCAWVKEQRELLESDGMMVLARALEGLDGLDDKTGLRPDWRWMSASLCVKHSMPNSCARPVWFLHHQGHACVIEDMVPFSGTMRQFCHAFTF